MKLTEQERVTANQVIKSLNAGHYTIKQMYGDAWQEIQSPTNFGKRFKSSVICGDVCSVKLISKKSDNHWLYSVK